MNHISHIGRFSLLRPLLSKLASFQILVIVFSFGQSEEGVQEHEGDARMGCFFFLVPLMLSFACLRVVDFAFCHCAPGFIPDFEDIVSISDAIRAKSHDAKEEWKFSWFFFFFFGHSSFYVGIHFTAGFFFPCKCTVKYRNWPRNIIDEAHVWCRHDCCPAS